MPALKVFGHYISQPSRSVLWLLKIHNVSFEFHKVEPINGDTRKEEYKSKFPTALIPAIDDDGYCLAEGSAILQYLCEKNNWNQWWPSANDETSRKNRGKIAEYLSHYHHAERLISHRVFRPVVEEMMFKKPLDRVEQVKRVEYAQHKVQKFANVFLSDAEFVNGMTTPTIADLVAYSEIAQLRQIGVISKFDAPAVQSWCDRMQQIPHHDDVHKSLIKMGEVISANQKIV
jgi:glutathione S-transferase